MKNVVIKITLKYFTNECMGRPRPYEVTNSVNAVAPKYPNPENIYEEVVLHVGDRISEKAAEKLVELYEVTTIPA